MIPDILDWETVFTNPTMHLLYSGDNIFFVSDCCVGIKKKDFIDLLVISNETY